MSVFTKEMKAGVMRRYQTCCARSNTLSVQGPQLNDFQQVVEESVNNGFICDYCGRLMTWGDEGKGRLMSIDHVLALSQHGSNDYANLAVCCYSCNMLKGHFGYEFFVRLIDLILKHEPKLLDELHEKVKP